MIVTVIRKGDQMYFCTLHKSRLLELMNNDFADLPSTLKSISTKRTHDDGYFIIDFDDKIIFSNQTGFSSDAVKNNKIKKWNYIENI